MVMQNKELIWALQVLISNQYISNMQANRQLVHIKNCFLNKSVTNVANQAVDFYMVDLTWLTSIVFLSIQ